MINCDLLVCGAGPVGCTIANRAATLLGLKVLVIDRRNHIAGNCYDSHHSSGIFIHNYGPHYFRTDNSQLLGFLSNFTEWIPGNYIIKSSVGGELYPFPINLDTLEKFFKRPLTEAEAIQLLNQKRLDIKSPQNSEELVLSKIGGELYEAFYKNYTHKQWDKSAKELAPSVCGRIPVRFDRRPNYVDQKHQVTPKHGFTAMFGAMLNHPSIELKLGVEFNSFKNQVNPRVATIYSGAIDEYFGLRFGRLGWRSLEFDYQSREQELVQPCVQINYPNDFSYTRTVEYKHITGQICKNTLISYEYPRANGDPYYPIPTVDNEALFRKYADLAEREERDKKVFFVGRLATYRYLNTDEVIEEALKCYQKIGRLVIEDRDNIPNGFDAPR